MSAARHSVRPCSSALCLCSPRDQIGFSSSAQLLIMPAGKRLPLSQLLQDTHTHTPCVLVRRRRVYRMQWDFSNELIKAISGSILHWGQTSSQWQRTFALLLKARPATSWSLSTFHLVWRWSHWYLYWTQSFDQILSLTHQIQNPRAAFQTAVSWAAKRKGLFRLAIICLHSNLTRKEQSRLNKDRWSYNQ